MEQFTCIPDLHKIKFPTLVIHDETDDIISLRESEFIASKISNIKIIRISKVGHYVSNFLKNNIYVFFV